MLSAGVKRELTWIIAFIWAVLFIGWLIECWIGPSIFFMVIYIARQLWSTHKFEKWIQGEENVIHPPVSGFWSEVSYQVSKKQRALEKHADLYLYKSEQFKAASMLLPSAIVSLDKDNHIEWFNEPSKKILGLRRMDIGRRVEGILRQPEFLSFLANERYDNSITLTLKQGRTYEIRLIQYFEDHKLLIAQDITQIYQLAQVRRDFVANASHELRTPLTVLHGYLELMQEMRDNPLWEKPLEQMHNQTIRMRSIIEDLLTLSSMEADAITASAECVWVPELLDKLQLEVERLSENRHQFVFEIDPNLAIEGYQEPLKSLFMNLLSNAVRYSPDGGTITAKWYRTDSGATFCVSDQGIGISAEHIPRLTERFYRVDKARSRVIGGTGLGLAIVKHVLEKHDSRLEVNSVYGHGSTFSCTFPTERIAEGCSQGSLPAKNRGKCLNKDEPKK